MARTDADAVKAVLLRDYDQRNTPSLTTFITSASLIVDRVATCAAAKGYTLSDALLLEMETWVAAYRYTLNNPVYSSKSTDGRSASFVRDGNPYKEGALALDPSGCLSVALDPKKATRPGFSWLGKRPSEATPYTDRD